jgi:hypothetical protein
MTYLFAMIIRCAFAAALLGSAAHAQTPVLQWAHVLSGPNNLPNFINNCRAVTTDPAGNVYTLGEFANNLDLDPGADQVLVTSNAPTDHDLFLAAYGADGSYLWGGQLVTSSATVGDHMDRMPGGDLVIGGRLTGTIDLDMGSGVLGLTGEGDMFFARYTSAGNAVWGATIGSTSGVDQLHDVAVDPAGNIWLVGAINDSIDLDPGPGLALFTCTPDSRDGFIAKYDAGGNFLWGHTFGSAQIDQAKSIAFTPAGNAVVTGHFNSGIDVQPGAGVTQLFTTNSSVDAFVITYSPTGQVLGSFGFGGGANTMEPMGVGVDAAGNILTTGIISGSGGSFVAGQEAGNVSAGSFTWGWLAKHSATGTLLWADVFQAGSSSGPGLRHLAVDADGDAYVAGASTVTFDADPGSPNLPLSSGYTLKLSGANGALLWSISTGSGFQFIEALHVDPNGDLCIAGGGNASWSYNGTFLASGNVAVLLRTGECLPTQVITEPNVNSDYCAPATEVLAIEAQGTLLQYAWTMNGAPVGTGADTLQVGPLPAGTYTFTCVVSGLCGVDSTSEVVLAVSPTPEPVIVDFAGTLTCLNAAGSFQWSLNGVPIPGANSGVWVPQAIGNYTVMVGDGVCFGTSLPFFFAGTGLTEVDAATFRLIPLPDGRGFTVTGPAPGTLIELLDRAGRCVRQWRVTGLTTTCRTADLPQGLYLVRSAAGAARFMR